MIICATALSALYGRAQEPPVLASFTAVDREDGVHLEWVMQAGNTCEGITVLRSVNGSDLQPIGGIGGICGSISEPITYTYTDRDVPELAMLDYRLLLGLNGYSPILNLRSTRIRTVDIRLYPLPVINELNVSLRAGDQAEVELGIFTTDGRLLLGRTGLRGHFHTLSIGALGAGTYLLRATVDGSPRVERFMVR